MIEGHGDDIYAYGGAVRHNFSSNILSGVNHGALAEHLSGCIAAGIGSYPEPQPGLLERMMAQRLSVSPENVMVTNGATEAIYLIAHAYAGAESYIVVPAFSEYEDACALYSHKLAFIDRHCFTDCFSAGKGESAATGKRPECVWLCNPNNPAGYVTDVNLLRDVIACNQDTLFVIDQAYADYTSRPVLDAEEVARAANVILFGSFTKRFSVPGLRVGYAVGGGGVLSRVKSFRMPWSVSGVAIEGAKYLLEHSDEYRIDCESLHAEAMRLTEGLRDMGIGVDETDCNFVLCHLPHGTARELKEWLVAKYGILIRDASNFRGLTDGYFRVAAQSEEENDLLISALKEWIGR